MENRENSQSNKPHLLYMTGLSIDKKQLNYITENIHFDKDFRYWFDFIDKKTEKAFGGFQSWITEYRETIEKDGVNVVAKIGEAILDISGAKMLLKPVVTKIIENVTRERIELSKNNDLLVKFIQESTNRRKSYKIDDFFSLYVSHQSDSIGVMPLSKLSQERDFNFINTYCDKDYFENRYIDNIIVKVDTRFVNIEMRKKLNEFVNEVFTTHLFDIFTSKIFLENEFQDTNANTLSILGFNQVQLNYYKNMKEAFSERNFFGINLLSYFFAGIQKIIDTQSKIIKVFLDCEDKSNNEYLKELIEYSISPDIISFVDKEAEAILTIKLYTSNGKNILNKNLKDDIYFKNFNSLNDNNEYSVLSFKEDIQSEELSYYNGDHYGFIKLPIKMMLSLPLDKEENPKQSLYIPYMVDNEKQNKISIITVGGAEHNRALAHLINKHRFEYKDERIFGFLDNYFDLDHKLNYIADSRYSESFLMALNQPVAGYNAIFVQRTDDENGFSNTWDAKLLGYVLKDKDREYNIVSVYGFSALSSVYAIHNVISSIDNSQDDNIIFNSNSQYIEDMDRGDIKKDGARLV